MIWMYLDLDRIRSNNHHAKICPMIIKARCLNALIEGNDRISNKRRHRCSRRRWRIWAVIVFLRTWENKPIKHRWWMAAKLHLHKRPNQIIGFPMWKKWNKILCHRLMANIQIKGKIKDGSDNKISSSKMMRQQLITTNNRPIHLIRGTKTCQIQLIYLEGRLTLTTTPDNKLMEDLVVMIKAILALKKEIRGIRGTIRVMSGGKNKSRKTWFRSEAMSAVTYSNRHRSQMLMPISIRNSQMSGKCDLANFNQMEPKSIMITHLIHMSWSCLWQTNWETSTTKIVPDRLMRTRTGWWIWGLEDQSKPQFNTEHSRAKTKKVRRRVSLSVRAMSRPETQRSNQLTLRTKSQRKSIKYLVAASKMKGTEYKTMAPQLLGSARLLTPLSSTSESICGTRASTTRLLKIGSRKATLTRKTSSWENWVRAWTSLAKTTEIRTYPFSPRGTRLCTY